MAGKYERLLVVIQTGAAEKIDRGVLQAPFGNAELELHGLPP